MRYKREARLSRRTADEICAGGVRASALHRTASPSTLRAQPSAVLFSRHTVDVVTGDNELVHVQTDTCGSTAFVQIKLWVDF